MRKMEELLKIDPSFNEGMFITKVNNIFIMLHSAIMMDDLDRVRHFLSSDLQQKYEEILKDLNKRNVRKMYDDLNVKRTFIKDIVIKEDCVIIKVDIESRYMDYLVDKETNNFISGVNDHRVEKTNHLELTKMLGSKLYGSVKKCPGCGANIDINNNGKCAYCGTIFDTEKYDWILTSIIVEG